MFYGKTWRFLIILFQIRIFNRKSLLYYSFNYKLIEPNNYLFILNDAWNQMTVVWKRFQRGYEPNITFWKMCICANTYVSVPNMIARIVTQNWEDIVVKSLSHLVGNEIVLNVQNDDPAHMIASLRTLIDCSIQLITSAKDEPVDKLKRENSRGTFWMS